MWPRGTTTCARRIATGYSVSSGRTKYSPAIPLARLHKGIQLYYCISGVHRYSTCEADVIFKEIHRDGRLGVLPTENAPRLVELIGPCEERLGPLQAAINARGRLGARIPSISTGSPSPPLPRDDVG